MCAKRHLQTLSMGSFLRGGTSLVCDHRVQGGKPPSHEDIAPSIPITCNGAFPQQAIVERTLVARASGVRRDQVSEGGNMTLVARRTAWEKGS
ncbi:uncharacterized protein B0I36DRAFT_330934 [Microdochium trichocladiopsis]|uniref:Uncharacterized protein n=1 Tax=Microdochium trichocladiopsis TaxID=1682393 RepID=A0A9P9BMS4_9PEZI|nr:uncharacterized protein B0I36DRAFT_330934 [Microdochium trichocladiopsis]KAH7026575.1 hypothetical protein B0I36DRAFT_330934 [Microdochium trichocladiopsis]